MATACLLVAASLATTARAADADDLPAGKRVLFIGNSYTYYHAMPRLVSELAELNGAPHPVVKTVTVGGARLGDHWLNGDAQQAIDSAKWDVVVLQEASQQPFIDDRSTRRYVASFADRIRRAGAQPAIYLTWARAYAPERQLSLNSFYRALGLANNAMVVPVGPAWQIAMRMQAGLRLHDPDDSHPSLAGSCIAAYAFHAAIWQRPAETPHPACAEWHAIAVAAVAEAIDQERLQAQALRR
ncbi:SGNH/GDSL hydrolase family protein [Noviherbaspirillum galbum]|uniref:SGNH/GDSL hydrolase family protein n=1 Tax=Noviherbaspirillum galbum TaxID=2709383 RepID=A0A6B3SWR5_9BURK|nr:SGNH/GDSL hydrolase family protein [Noviherbaspirillum galbum]NEX63915.1 SGNH/GDSL hydrolase family protein [Noviherbaspirillum galbum]